MTTPTTGTTAPPHGPEKIEDLVKKALKEALDKRKTAEAEKEPSELLSTLVESVVEKDYTPAPKKTLSKNEKYFSEVTSIKVEHNSDFAVSVFHDYKWDDCIAPFIPKVNPDYVLDATLSANILKAWEMNEKVLCYGPTGAGKSSLVQQLCALTNRPFVRINCTGDMDSSMLFGQLTAKDGSTIWVDGAVTEAVKHGAVFAWDEWEVTPPEITMGLQWLLEDDGKLFLKEKPGTTSDKMITPHEYFRLVAIGNTQGQGDDTGAHAGTNVQNTASLDRFGTAIYVDYLPALVEEKMLLQKWSSAISKSAVKELVKLANLIRQGYKAGQFNLTLSPRSLLSICKKIHYGSSLGNAFALVYLNKLNNTQRKVAEELFTKIYGKTA